MGLLPAARLRQPRLIAANGPVEQEKEINRFGEQSTHELFIRPVLEDDAP